MRRDDHCVCLLLDQISFVQSELLGEILTPTQFVFLWFANYFCTFSFLTLSSLPPVMMVCTDLELMMIDC